MVAFLLGCLVVVQAICLVLVASSAVPGVDGNRKPVPARSGNRLLLTRGGSTDTTSKLFRRFSDVDRMPSLFPKDEDLYDKYAACLAATEGLRRIRDSDMAAEVEALKKGTSRATSLSEVRSHVTTKYVQNSIKVLRALGMPVGEFNELGRIIATDPELKQKV